MSKLVLHEIDGKELPLEIRRSTDEDLQEIYNWLRVEESQGIDGNFLCNWNLTEKCHRSGELLVLVSLTDGMPLGYEWGHLLHSGILQIRNNCRGKGLGRLIVEYCIEVALEQNEMVLEVQCEPLSSVSFWKTMGFTIVEEDFKSSIRGYRILSQPLKLPPDGFDVNVRISVFPEARKWEKNIEPTVTLSPHAVSCNNGKLYFAERVSFPTIHFDHGDDPVIEILVGTKLSYLDKMKYPEAKRRGLKSCTNGFFMDDWVAF